MCTVTSDNIAGGEKVADLLISLEHKRISYIAGWEGASTQRDREFGFVTKLNENGISLFSREVGNFKFDEAQSATYKLFKNKSIPDYLENFWSLSELENNNLLNTKSKKISSAQTKILNYIGKNRIPISEFDLINVFPSVKQSLNTLEKNGLIKKENSKDYLL